jgi:hypothetical protein
LRQIIDDAQHVFRVKVRDLICPDVAEATPQVAFVGDLE